MKLLLALLLFMSAAVTLKAEETTSSSNVMLYYTPTCPHSVRVIAYLEKIGKTIPMTNLKEQPQAKADLRAVLGNELRVPCLVVNGRPILGEEPIMEWIQDHPEMLMSTESEMEN